MGWALLVLGIIDVYVFYGLRRLFSKKSGIGFIRFLYVFFSMLTLLVVVLYMSTTSFESGKILRRIMFYLLMFNYVPKVFSAIVLLLNDAYRLGVLAISQLKPKPKEKSSGELISRSEFISKVALASASVPVAVMGFGILSGAYDYRIRKQTIYLPNLPKSFDGITIGQLSDIHSGSFFNKRAVMGGVEMFLSEKPDLIFFTGDLVNNAAKEVEPYVPVFGKLKAPYGVYSVLGNHDYGDYMRWPNMAAKQRNLENLMSAHQQMGWTLLMNEHHYLQESGDKLAILGVENWGAGRFKRYGKLADAYAGSDEGAAKILLSHDPSHWDAQIRNYEDIDLTLSGHTHGFQFGVEIGDFKWSPSQYIYKQWAGLYQEGQQYLYVNRGFGFVAYPGRVGILPELTILTLKSQQA